MRKTGMKLLAAALAVVILIGCQATPEQEIVVQKDLEQMIEKAQATPEAMESTGITLAERLGAPETYEAVFSNAKGSVTVNVDADVMLPDTDAISTARVKEMKFSQETADKLRELLLQGQPFYDYGAYTMETKDDVMEKLLELYAMREGTIPVEVDGDLEETITLYEKEYEDAPDERTFTPAQTTFHQRDAQYEPFDCIEGVAELGGETAYFYIQNDTDGNRIFANYYSNVKNQFSYSAVNEFKGMFIIDEAKLTMDITAEQARVQADTFIQGLGLSSNMVCGSIEAGIDLDDSTVLMEGDEINYSATQTVWILRYVRTVEGIPMTYTGDTGSNVESEEDYAQPWPYETMYLMIDETGIVEFHWTSPYTDPEIVTSDTNLPQFAEIQQVFEKMVLINYSYFETGALQIDIDSVQLGLMRVTDIGDRDSGILIPVWDFMGSVTAIREGEEPDLWQQTSSSRLTINAIDGSIIDRGLGY